MAVDWALIRNGLWENAQDAMKHGAEHFRAYSDSGRQSKHDLKWAVLSAHQVAECFCNILLIDITPEDKVLVKRGAPWFPSLRVSTERLLKGTASQQLRNEERRLVALYKTLPDIRDQLTHGAMPSEVEASDAAISLLGTLNVSRNRVGLYLSEYELDSPRIENEIHAAIPYKRDSDYVELAYDLLRGHTDTSTLGICGQCGKHSVDMRLCQLCYTEYESIECPQCDEKHYYQSWESPLDIECICGQSLRA